MVTGLSSGGTSNVLSPPTPSLSLVHENDAGNVEYKLQILPSPTRFTRLVTQLNWRLVEGMGTCYYGLGVMDDGSLLGVSSDDMRRSIENLCAMARSCGATATLRWLATVQGGGIQVITRRQEAVKLLGQDLDNGASAADGVLCIELNQVPEALHGSGIVRGTSPASTDTTGSPETPIGQFFGTCPERRYSNSGICGEGHPASYESQSCRLARLVASDEDHLLSVVSSRVDLYATDRLVAEICVTSGRDMYIDFVL